MAAPARVRLAELVATISLGTDLGLGQPMEHVIRQTIIALRLADLLDLDDAEREVVYYAGLLAWVGCRTDAYEQSKWFGDDIAMKRDVMFVGSTLPEIARFVASHVGAGAGPLDRIRTGLAFPRGTQFDPDLVELLCRNAPDVLAGLDAESHWAEILDAEPGLAREVDDDGIDQVLAAMGDFADLKSPYFIGHSGEVAELAGRAAELMGLPGPEVTTIRRAGLVHDLGRLGVSNAVWDKPGRLTLTEMERVRMHPYLTERMLVASPLLAEGAAVAVLHHERPDGSGHPRGLSGNAIPTSGRVLAAADRYATLTAERPHRPAHPAAVAADLLRDDVRAGRLDGPAVDAVLTAAGHRVRRRGAWPGGLTNREVEVLRLLTLGLTNRRIAERLQLSPKTVGAHVEHIYAKTGATNRATVGLFAMQHGLTSDFER